MLDTGFGGAHAVTITIGNIPSLERFQVLPSGKSRIKSTRRRNAQLKQLRKESALSTDTPHWSVGHWKDFYGFHLEIAPE